jgi:hypothetical protein
LDQTSGEEEQLSIHARCKGSKRKFFRLERRSARDGSKITGTLISERSRNMKKLIAVAGLCIVAVVALPAASASAFKGACTLEGTATIYASGGFTTEHALPVNTTEKLSYKFNTTANTGTCGTTELAQEPVEAEVAGEGNLGCKESESTTFSKGSIKIASGPLDTLTSFSFTGKGTEVSFESEGPKVHGLAGGAAKGHASFSKSAEAVEKCKPGSTEGPKKLKFIAVTEGEIS